MVFQGSDVPLSEDILKKPIEFVRTWVEWASENRQQIIRTAVAPSNLFTVPDNNTLWITSAYVSANNSSVGDDAVSLGINNNFEILRMRSLAGGSNNSLSNSFPMPLKVEEGLTISLSSNATNTTAGFTGFIVPKQIAGRTRL